MSETQRDVFEEMLTELLDRYVPSPYPDEDRAIRGEWLARFDAASLAGVEGALWKAHGLLNDLHRSMAADETRMGDVDALREEIAGVLMPDGATATDADGHHREGRPETLDLGSAFHGAQGQERSCECGRLYALIVGRVICSCGRELIGLEAGYYQPAASAAPPGRNEPRSSAGPWGFDKDGTLVDFGATAGDGWIPVEERLPEEGDFVLVVETGIRAEIGRHYGGRWADEEGCKQAPSHWRPLPESPK